MCLLIENDFNKLKCVLISAQVQGRSWGMKLKLLTLGKKVWMCVGVGVGGEGVCSKLLNLSGVAKTIGQCVFHAVISPKIMM